MLLTGSSDFQDTDVIGRPYKQLSVCRQRFLTRDAGSPLRRLSLARSGQYHAESLLEIDLYQRHANERRLLSEETLSFDNAFKHASNGD